MPALRCYCPAAEVVETGAGGADVEQSYVATAPGNGLAHRSDYVRLALRLGLLEV